MARILGDSRDKELAAFREQQAEMLHLSQEFSQERLALWAREVEEMGRTWDNWQREWHDALHRLTEESSSTFAMISANGETAGQRLRQSWKKSLADMSAEVTTWAEGVQKVLGELRQAWMALTPVGSGDDWPSWPALGFDFGGWFHHGGVVEAHRGMVVAPERLLGEEQLVMVQSGEGILPRDTMLRLGRENFDALRRGQFELHSGPQTSQVHVNINIQALDAAGVAGLDWPRLVHRHLLPALEKELGRRW